MDDKLIKELQQLARELPCDRNGLDDSCRCTSCRFRKTVFSLGEPQEVRDEIRQIEYHIMKILSRTSVNIDHELHEMGIGELIVLAKNLVNSPDVEKDTRIKLAAVLKKTYGKIGEVPALV